MILSIESSCDDSSIAITEIESKKVLFHTKISQELEHSVYGGVVPELAARLHAKALPDILEQAKEYFPSLKAIAVTNEPGLSVTLVEGVMMAQALSISLNLPIITVNHLYGHIYSLFIEKETHFPQTILLVSGGHTMVVDAQGFDDFSVIASTMDDSFGESFDKVAKMLGLGYPGGPVVERLAREGDEHRFDFTVPLYHSAKVAFSYSGLKNPKSHCTHFNFWSHAFIRCSLGCLLFCFFSHLHGETEVNSFSTDASRCLSVERCSQEVRLLDCHAGSRGSILGCDIDR